MNIPARFSREWWALIVSVGFTCGAVSVLVLFLAGVLSSSSYFWAFVIGGAVGDIVMALVFEAVAPTHVTVGPGERLRSDSPLHERGRVVSDFTSDGMGKVRVRGEVWAARCLSVRGGSFVPGQEVRIAGREGLTLIVDLVTNEA